MGCVDVLSRHNPNEASCSIKFHVMEIYRIRIPRKGIGTA
jgi:hypothetical protein